MCALVQTRAQVNCKKVEEMETVGEGDTSLREKSEAATGKGILMVKKSWKLFRRLVIFVEN